MTREEPRGAERSPRRVAESTRGDPRVPERTRGDPRGPESTREHPRTCPPSASASLGQPRISAKLLPTRCCRLNAAQLLSAGLSYSLLPDSAATGGPRCYWRASDSLARSSADGSAHTISSYLLTTRDHPSELLSPTQSLHRPARPRLSVCALRPGGCAFAGRAAVPGGLSAAVIAANLGSSRSISGSSRVISAHLG